jgi:hypothetical protein
MNKIARIPRTSPMTVGQLISELCLHPDRAVLHLRCTTTNEVFHLSRIGVHDGNIEFELEPELESVPLD